MKNAVAIIKKYFVQILLGFGLATAGTTAAVLDANNLIVPNEYATISAALSAVQSGQTITVQAGTYNEAVLLTKSGVTLQAVGTVKALSIRVTGSNNVIRGFTLSDKTSDWGIRTEGNDNLIENNEITGTMQDGIWFFGSRNTFKNNYIHDILDPSIPGDPHVDCFQTWDWNWNTDGTVIENNICDHGRTKDSNQIIIVTGSTRTTNTIIRGNRFIMSDAGYSPIALYGGKGYVIENNYICNKTGAGSVAVYVSGGSNITLTGNTWAGYSGLYSGTVSAQSGNVKGRLPCQVFPDVGTPAVTPAPSITLTKTLTFTPTNTRTFTPLPASPTLTRTPSPQPSATKTATPIPATVTPQPTVTPSKIPPSPTPSMGFCWVIWELDNGQTIVLCNPVIGGD